MELHLKKNQAAELMIPMVDSAAPENLKSGLTVTDTAWYRDGTGAWTSLAVIDTMTELGSTGMYTIELTASELNHDLIMIKFTSAGAADSVVIVRMFAVDIDGLVRSTAPANTLDVEAGGTVGIDFSNINGTHPAVGTVTSVTNDVGITQAGADKVWNSAARTLTSFGTLASDVWSNGTRTLTALGSSLVDEIWDSLTSGMILAGSVGKKLADWVLTAGKVTVGTNDDKTGYSISGTKTTLDALNLPVDPASETNVDANETKIDSLQTDMTAIKVVTDSFVNSPTLVGAIWDEILTGATHNIATSAGRRLRDTNTVLVLDNGTAQGGSISTITLAAGAKGLRKNNSSFFHLIFTPSSGENIFKIGLLFLKIFSPEPDANLSEKKRSYFFSNPNANDDWYLHGFIIIDGGTGIGQARLIEAYVGGTKVATIVHNWIIAPDVTSTYQIISFGFVHANEVDIVNDKLGYSISGVKTTLDSLNMPVDPASETNVNANETKIDSLQTDMTAVKARTDNLPVDTAALLDRILGLNQENYYLDNAVYSSGQLTSGRIRIYSDAASVGTGSNVTATYQVTATYAAGVLSNYKVTKQ